MDEPQVGAGPLLQCAVLDDVHVGCQVLDAENRYLYLNKAAALHGRRDRSALLGRTLNECFPGPETTRLVAVIERVRASQRVETLENLFLFPDGARGWFDLRIEPVPQGVIILSVDVTRRHEAEAARQRARRAYATLSAANQALVHVDDEVTFLENVCRVVAEVGGYTLAWVGLAQDDARHSVLVAASAGSARAYVESLNVTWDEAPTGQGPTGRAIRSGETVVVRGLATDPGFAPWRARARAHGVAASCAIPLHVGGRVVGALNIYAGEEDSFDDGERALLDELAADLGLGLTLLRTRASLKATEEQLRALQRQDALGKLVGGVAHDFNNLLAVILSYTTVTLEALPSASSLRQDLAEARQAAMRAATLTRQLMTFARKRAHESRVVSPQSVVEGMVPMLQRLLGEDVRLSCQLDATMGHIRVDPGQLEQVLMNLAVNARDAMGEGGSLAIRGEGVRFDEPRYAHVDVVEPGTYVALSVTDTGCGMDMETQARIFEPFFTTKAEGHGTGLGLSTVYSIVQQNGGAIECQSAPGRGTTFTVYLPQVAPGEAVAEPEKPAVAVRGGETVLVVEDDAGVRRVVERSLRAAGFNIVSTENAAEAFRLALDLGDALGLVLTDVIMPEESGPELARRLRERNPRLRVVYMSGYPERMADADEAADAHARFLAKPFTANELVQCIRSALDDVSSAPGSAPTN